MKLKTKYFLLMFIAATLGEGAALAKVSVIQSPSAALVPGATFALAPAGMGSSDPRLNNDIVEARLRTAIESSLAARGYRMVSDPAQASLIVSYQAELQDKAEVRLQGRGGFCGIRIGCIQPDYDVNNINYTQGTLMIDLREAKTGKLVWRATSDKRVKSKDASQEKLNKALLEMTKSLPPA